MVGTFSKIAAAVFGSKTSLTSAYPSTASVWRHDVDEDTRSEKIRRRRWSSFRLSKRKKDQNRLNGGSGGKQQEIGRDVRGNNGLEAVDTTKLRPPSRPPLEPLGPILPPSPPPELPPEPVIETPDPKALSALKHAATGVEALSALINHLVFTLDAFSTPRLKQELENMRSGWIRTEMELEEARASYNQLKEEFNCDKISRENALQEAVNEFHNQLSSLRVQNEKEVEDLTVQYNDDLTELKQKINEMERNMKESYEKEMGLLREMSESEKLNLTEEHSRVIERLNSVIKAMEGKLEEFRKKEDELLRKVEKTEADNSELKRKLQIYSERISNDKDSKVTLQRIDQLESEVSSLRTVLELKSGELQELRKRSCHWQRDAEQLPGSLQKITTLRARLEDLQAQLEHKEALHQDILKENRILTETIAQEEKEKKRLLMQNEELVWKLKQNAEVANTLVAYYNDKVVSAPLGNDIKIYTSPKTTNRISLNSRFSDGEKLRGEQGLMELSQKSPPSSPKIKDVVEKNDSVAWVLNMEDPPEFIASRILRRAQSFRATATSTPNSTPGSQTRGKPRTKSCNEPEEHITEEVIIVKSMGDQDVLELLEIEDSKEIHIEAPQLRKMEKAKSDEELQMIRRVEESALRDEITLPKDSAGEAMISEETSDDDIGLDDDFSSEELLIERKDRTIKIDAKVVKHSLISCEGPDSLSNTAMDLSWSEDHEILPSEG